MAEDDLVTQILTAPFIWILLMLVAIYFIAGVFYSNKVKPEQRPFYGKEVRDKMTRKQINNRSKTWGSATNYKITKGLDKIGKIKSLETIYIAGKDKNDDLKEFYSLRFVPKGFVAWLKSWIGMYEHLVIDPKVVTIRQGEKILDINPKAHIIESSGVWILATNKEIDFINDLNLEVENENILGYTTDYLRRLSEQNPGQSIFTERMATAALLEEESKKARVSRWVGGKS